MYIKQGLKINLLPLINNDFCQYVRFQVGGTNSDQKIILYLIYRSPNSNLANNDKLLDLIGTIPNNTVLIGDFNLSNTNWANNRANDNKGCLFLDKIVESGLEQLVDFPTHIRGNTLDICLSNWPDLFIDISDIGNIGNSDHLCIMFEIDVRKTTTNYDTPILDWKNADKEP